MVRDVGTSSLGSLYPRSKPSEAIGPIGRAGIARAIAQVPMPGVETLGVRIQ